MATTSRNKLNALYTHWTPGTPLTSEDLAALGISADLAVHYVRAGWLTRLMRGVYCRPNDTLALHPSLVLLQRKFHGLHVGGKSALDWYGDQGSWLRLIQNAMREDFSWGRQVERYIEVFRATAQRAASSSA